MAFWQKNTAKHGILEKSQDSQDLTTLSRFPWFPCFRDFLLSLHIAQQYIYTADKYCHQASNDSIQFMNIVNIY